MDQAAADLILRSFGDPARRQVARILAEAPLTVGEVSDVLGLPQSTVSRHLKSLRATGLLVDRREGPRVYIGLIEPSGIGTSEELGQVLNTWLRQQPLNGAVEARLRRALASRNGSDDAFERLAHQWDELRFEHFGSVFHLEAMASLLPAEWTVLDAGTGTGYLLPFLSGHFREVVAADASPAMLELARQRAEKAKLKNVDFRLGRLEALPIGESTIDCAVVMLALRHSPDPERALAELARVVVDGGRVLVVDIGPHNMEDFRRRIGDASLGIDPSDVARGLERAGFGITCQRVLSLPEAGGPARPTRPAPDLFLVAAARADRDEVPNGNRKSDSH